MNWYLRIATLGPIGYLPAPGTMATIVTLPLVYGLHTLFSNEYAYCAVVASVAVVGLWVTRNALHSFCDNHDPSEIVIDEVVGCLVTFCGVALSWQTMLAGFILFRLFDIFKICGVHYFERFNGEWGVMLDDIFAGLLSMLILRLVF